MVRIRKAKDIMGAIIQIDEDEKLTPGGDYFCVECGSQLTLADGPIRPAYFKTFKNKKHGDNCSYGISEFIKKDKEAVDKLYKRLMSPDREYSTGESLTIYNGKDYKQITIVEIYNVVKELQSEDVVPGLSSITKSEFLISDYNKALLKKGTDLLLLELSTYRFLQNIYSFECNFLDDENAKEKTIFLDFKNIGIFETTKNDILNKYTRFSGVKIIVLAKINREGVEEKLVVDIVKNFRVMGIS